MWITIFELPNGDIESVELFWDKQVCYERAFANEYGLDEKGYVDDDFDDYGKNRVIEIEDEKVNEMFMFLLHKYIIECDSKYLDSKICDKDIEEWL